MIETVGLVAFGLVVGCYGTLVGIGGGPLLVPMLTMVYKFPTSTVIAVSLAAVVTNTVSGSVGYLRQGRVDIVSATKFGLATIPGSLVSTFIVDYIQLSSFSVYCGIFLLLLAVYVFFKPVADPSASVGVPAADAGRPQCHADGGKRVLRDVFGVTFRYQINEPLGIAVTALIGVISTFLGIGGGLIQVPVLVYLLGFPTHIGTATSHLITAINATFTIIPFIVHGDIAYGPVGALALGIVVGAQVGARLSPRISGQNLLRLLVPVLILAGARLALA